MSLLTLEHVGKHYGSGAHSRIALRDVSFEVEPGQLVAVWGRRRSGRSTLLRIAAGVERPDTGLVRFEGRDIYQLPSRGLDDIGYCRTSFRPSEGHLVLDHLLLGQLANGVKGETARVRASEALRRVGADRLAALSPRDLDAAERVRVGIARALVRRPHVLVIDEPAIGVDLLARDSIFSLLRSLATEEVAVLTSTADTAGLESADLALALSDGELNGSAVPENAAVIPLRRASGR